MDYDYDQWFYVMIAQFSSDTILYCKLLIKAIIDIMIQNNITCQQKAFLHNVIKHTIIIMVYFLFQIYYLMLSYRFTLHTIGKSREYLCNLFHNSIAFEHYNCVINLTTMIQILFTLVYEQVLSLIHVYGAGGVRKSPCSEIELIPKYVVQLLSALHQIECSSIMYVYTLSKEPLPSAMLKIFALQFNYSCNQLPVTKFSLLLYMSTSFINEIFNNILICGNTLILEKIYLNYVILVHCYKTVIFVSLCVFYVFIFILTITPILYSKQTSYLNNVMRSILNSTLTKVFNDIHDSWYMYLYMNNTKIIILKFSSCSLQYILYVLCKHINILKHFMFIYPATLLMSCTVLQVILPHFSNWLIYDGG